MNLEPVLKLSGSFSRCEARRFARLDRVVAVNPVIVVDQLPPRIHSFQHLSEIHGPRPDVLFDQFAHFYIRHPEPHSAKAAWWRVSANFMPLFFRSQSSSMTPVIDESGPVIILLGLAGLPTISLIALAHSSARLTDTGTSWAALRRRLRR